MTGWLGADACGGCCCAGHEGLLRGRLEDWCLWRGAVVRGTCGMGQLYGAGGRLLLVAGGAAVRGLGGMTLSLMLD